MATGCASCSCSPVFATAWNALNSTHNHAIGGTPCFLRRPAALALPLFSILCFLGSILQVPKVIAKPNASDSDRTALHAASSPDRLGEMDFFPRLLDLLVSNLAVLLSQIRKVELLLLDSWTHRLVSTLKPRLPAWFQAANRGQFNSGSRSHALGLLLSTGCWCSQAPC